MSNTDFYQNFEIGETPDYIAYTDGACNNLSPYGEGGAAYIVLENRMGVLEPMTIRSKGCLNTTNNRMELLAIVSAILTTPDNGSLEVRTDSQYCILMANSKGEPSSNVKLVTMLRKAIWGRRIHITWVKGHNGEKYNELCDQLAEEEREKIRQQNNIPVYDYRNSPKVKKNKK